MTETKTVSLGGIPWVQRGTSKLQLLPRGHIQRKLVAMGGTGMTQSQVPHPLCFWYPRMMHRPALFTETVDLPSHCDKHEGGTMVRTVLENGLYSIAKIKFFPYEKLFLILYRSLILWHRMFPVVLGFVKTFSLKCILHFEYIPDASLPWLPAS